MSLKIVSALAEYSLGQFSSTPGVLCISFGGGDFEDGTQDCR